MDWSGLAGDFDPFHVHLPSRLIPRVPWTFPSKPPEESPPPHPLRLSAAEQHHPREPPIEVLVFTMSEGPKDICFDSLGLLFIFHLHEVAPSRQASFWGPWEDA